MDYSLGKDLGVEICNFSDEGYKELLKAERSLVKSGKALKKDLGYWEEKRS